MRRTIYVAGNVSANQQMYPAARVVDVLTMPRESAEENRKAIQAWLQGMVEGTIEGDDETRKSLELSAKLDGLLAQRTERTVKTTIEAGQSIFELLKLGPSRHTSRETRLETTEPKVELPGETDGEIRGRAGGTGSGASEGSGAGGGEDRKGDGSSLAGTSPGSEGEGREDLGPQATPDGA